MASALASAHIEAERRIRVAAERAVRSIWESLPGYDRENVDEWLSKVLPVVLASQRQSVMITDAYLARALERRPLGVDSAELAASLRGPVAPGEVYERPFVTVWTALKGGTAYPDAVNAGLARATGTAAMDVQMAMRSTANAVQDVDDAIFGFQRVADPGACEFCSLVDGAYVKSADAMALHNHCGCGLEVLTSPHSLAATLPSGVAVHQHGELGPVLGSPDHDFTQL